MVFTDLTLESVPPVGCLPGELLAECRPERAVVIQYRACWLEGADRDLRARSAEEGTPASFSCDSIPVSPRARLDYFAGMHVDGRRIVWSVGSATENPGIFFCEFDSERNECPVQRLMGAPAEESDPFLDGNRVVWREARGGPQGVWGFALPELVLPGPLALRAGRRFWIPVRVDPGSASSLSYSIEGLDGVSPESARAKVFDTRPAGGWAYLTGRLPKKATGTSQWRIRAEGEGGLYTESTLSFVAKPLPNGEARKRRRFFRGRW